MVKKVFLLDVQRPARFALNDILERRFDRNRFFVLEPPHTELLNINKDRVHLIDVRQHAGSFGWVKQIDYKRLETYESIVVSHFDYQLEIPSINQQKLYLLERLLKLNKPITVFSEVEPSLYQFSNGVSDEHGKNHDDQDRWAGMVSEFCTEYVEECGQRGFVETIGEVLGKKVCSENQKKKLINFFKDECSGKQPLERIGIQIICDSRFKTFTHEDLLRLILNQSTTYYSSIWRRCSPGEQLTLWHLAQDRLLSHRDPDIEPLMRRGLIVRKKDVHVMNESFRQFVLSANQAAVVSKIEETAKRDSAWNTLKAPLMIVLIAITIFLFATQRDLYTSALAGLTALTTMIPALFKVLSLFQKEQARPTVQT